MKNETRKFNCNLKKDFIFQHLEAKFGLRYSILAFLSWGILPIYWKFLNSIPDLEILAHLIVWSIIFLFIIGVYLYDESFSQTHSITFGLIWTGLFIFSINSLFIQRTS